MASEQVCWESKQKLIIERIRVRIRVRVRHYLWLAGCLCLIYSQSAGEPEQVNVWPGSGTAVHFQAFWLRHQSVLLWSATHTKTHTHTQTHTSLYIISLSLSGGGRPFHPSVQSSVPSSIHPSSSSRKKKMMEEEEEEKLL